MNTLTGRVIGAAMYHHSTFDPGMLESALFEPIHRARFLSYPKPIEKPVTFSINTRVDQLHGSFRRIMYDT